MKKLFLIAAAAAVVGLATPASAQVNIRAGENGVKVRVGGPAHPGVHRHGNWRRSHARACRVTKTRTVTPGGRVIVKTRRVCR